MIYKISSFNNAKESLKNNIGVKEKAIIFQMDIVFNIKININENNIIKCNNLYYISCNITLTLS